MKGLKFGIFWIEDGGYEDWFVVAPIPKTVHDEEGKDIAEFLAQDFFLSYEGYDTELECDDFLISHKQYVNAKLVTTIKLSDLPSKYKYRGRKNAEDYHNTYDETDWEKEVEEWAKAIMKPSFLKSIGNDAGNILNHFLTVGLCPNDGVDHEVYKKETNQDQVNSFIVAFHRLYHYLFIRSTGYAPFHGQIDLLEKAGFTIIDDGQKSNVRTVVFDGEIYSEGGMEADVRNAQRIHNVIHGQRPELN